MGYLSVLTEPCAIPWCILGYGCSLSPDQKIPLHLCLSGYTIQTSLCFEQELMLPLLCALRVQFPPFLSHHWLCSLWMESGEYDRVRRECVTRRQVMELPVHLLISVPVTVDQFISWIWISVSSSVKFKA